MLTKLALLASFMIFVSASALHSPQKQEVVVLSSGKAAGSGTCAAGCNECDTCLGGQRWQVWYPHFECQAGLGTCNNTYGDVLCNQIVASNSDCTGPASPLEVLDTTSTGECATTVVPPCQSSN